MSVETSGLSLVIPAVSDEITPTSIMDAVLREYFWAIIRNKLIVEVTMKMVQ